MLYLSVLPSALYFLYSFDGKTGSAEWEGRMARANVVPGCKYVWRVALVRRGVPVCVWLRECNVSEWMGFVSASLRFLAKIKDDSKRIVFRPLMEVDYNSDDFYLGNLEANRKDTVY